MKNVLQIFLIFIIFGITSNLQSQTIEELKNQKKELNSKISSKQTEINDLKSKISDLESEINVLSGWQTGIGANIGFSIGSNKNWISNPNPNSSSSSLSLGVSGFANNIKEKVIWRNSLLFDKQWLDVDLDGETGNDKLFDNGVVDVFNIASLAGYRLHPKVSLTALGELNTSLGSFFKPGTMDIGVGGTWTASDNFVVTVHPLNYHFAFSGYDNVKNESALGAKLRAEYNEKFDFIGKKLTFQSILTSFLPYSDKKSTITSNGESWEAGLFEYTWMNKITFSIFNGVGVNFGFGLRTAQYEIDEPQRIFSLGLGYSL